MENSVQTDVLIMDFSTAFDANLNMLIKPNIREVSQYSRILNGIAIDYAHINSVTFVQQRQTRHLGSYVEILTPVPPLVKEQAYKSLVQPSLEYACSVWDPCTKDNITQL